MPVRLSLVALETIERASGAFSPGTGDTAPERPFCASGGIWLLPLAREARRKAFPETFRAFPTTNKPCRSGPLQGFESCGCLLT